MLSTDRDALICDLAETYGILNYKALPVPLLATLSVGLRENSRIKMKLSGLKISTETLLLASAADSLAFLSWTKTEDAMHNRNRPKSLVSILTGRDTNENKGDVVAAFDTVEEFEAAWERIVGR